MISEIDRQLFVLINQKWHLPILDIIFPILTREDNSQWILAVIAIFCIWRGNRYLRNTALLAIIALVIGDALTQSIKEIVGRFRPFMSMESTRLLIGAGASYSFPSGHASSMFSAVLVIIWRHRKQKIVSFCLLVLALLVAYSRIYVGVHYPVDVLAGILVGIFAGIICLLIHSRYPIFPDTENTTDRKDWDLYHLFIYTVVIVTCIRLSFIASPWHSLTEEEAQYWDWSRHLDWSYYSKPPLIAYLIHLFTWIGGQNCFYGPIRVSGHLGHSVLSQLETLHENVSG